MIDYDYLTFGEVSHTNRKRKNKWHGEVQWTGSDWSNALAGETGEACNIVKKLRRIESGFRWSGEESYDQLVEKLGEELADVFLYVDLVADYYGLDLIGCIVAKFDKVSKREGFEERLGIDE